VEALAEPGNLRGDGLAEGLNALGQLQQPVMRMLRLLFVVLFLPAGGCGSDVDRSAFDDLSERFFAAAAVGDSALVMTMSTDAEVWIRISAIRRSEPDCSKRLRGACDRSVQ
jgi:hypothetical protein